MAQTRSSDLLVALDEAKLNRFHLKAVLASGMGFFTDAYDLFIIGIASVLVSQEWHVGAARLGLLNSMTLAASFIGAFVFGRIADVVGRKRVYWMVAAIMAVGALGSAFAPSFWTLIAFRFLLGLGIGGDYPISAVMTSEYANRRDRGKLVGTVFSTQALGLIIGPLVALTLLGSGAGHDIAWRLMLGLGALPAATVLYLRWRMPESPRYQAQVQGREEGAIRQTLITRGGQSLTAASRTTGQPKRERGAVAAAGGPGVKHGMGLRAFLSSRRYLIMLAGTAGSWFLFDYAYYGNTISTPEILGLVSPHASLITKTALELAIFVIAALPGYLLALARMDRIGHRRLQWVGFAVMALCFGLIGLVPGVSTAVAPFMIIYGISYFFAEFGPNTTTFVLPAELYPVSMRATGHGMSAGLAKFGAFIGVFVFPLMQMSLGLRGTLVLTAGLSAVGILLTMLLPEAAGRSLEELTGNDDVVAAAEEVIARASRKEEAARRKKEAERVA